MRTGLVGFVKQGCSSAAFLRREPSRGYFPGILVIYRSVILLLPTFWFSPLTSANFDGCRKVLKGSATVGVCDYLWSFSLRGFCLALTSIVEFLGNVFDWVNGSRLRDTLNDGHHSTTKGPFMICAWWLCFAEWVCVNRCYPTIFSIRTMPFVVVP